jgi:4-hydroxybenzoate polyprenyltransferase
MKIVWGLLKASHFIPTLLVTAISFVVTLYWWQVSSAVVIAICVFMGQLIVGWSNDLLDYQDDLLHQRIEKPLVAGVISKALLEKSLVIWIPLTFVVNLLGPLGITGGLLHMLAVLVGVSYNFYFKFSIFSPLPYAVAFGFLPYVIAVNSSVAVVWWLSVVGALFGVAAHFLNVIKDMKQDQMSGILGLPQRLGSEKSRLVARVFLMLGFVVFGVGWFS